MANTEQSRAVPLTLAERQRGLKQTTELWRLLPDEKYKGAVPELINELARTDPRIKAALYFIAGINKDRHLLSFNELASSEQINIIGAMNRLRALTSLFPERLTCTDCAQPADKTN